MEGDPGQDVEVDAALQPETADHVEAVELRLSGADVGQVPAGRWSGPPDSLPGVEGAAPVEDPGDRPDRGERAWQVASLLELAPDRRRAVLAERALLAKPAPDVENEVLQRAAGPRPVERQ